tara:strand:+ start:48 stop:263 length:216 start_codon:yes stop_codon:yes gene_type:complete
MGKINKAKKILNKYIELHNKGTHIEFENYKYEIFEQYGIDDSDWDKVFMWDKNPINTLLTEITYQLMEVNK